MATVMGATISLPNRSVIAGQRFTATLTLTESGGTNTNLVSIQPFIIGPGGQPCAARIGNVANSFTIGNYTGAAQVINASTSQVFNFECVIDGPSNSNQPSVGPTSYQLGATCVTSDGSVFAPVPVGFNVSASSQTAPNGQSSVIGTTGNAYSNVLSPGYLRFDYPNAILIAALG